ncbi:MAG: type II secretion system protein GspG [Candidatus Omnitrophica bacterium]|nr:type II secretion system protein GspG [Candidatus Omnitrophota bacterium]MCB9770051.1 type II secretion system protein GspG [Candidatus Omnitrophota bacterium]MCB9781354.1 type II secretion system protein GspG [Candidatus Omnitrophota bacterium]
MISTRLMEPAAKVLVPRIGSDLKSLEMAIRTYSFEWERFPTPDSTENEGFTPPALTSPIPYVVKLPADPYSDDGTYPYRYEVASSTGEETAIFLSPGPDRVIGFPFEDLVKHGVRGFNRWLYAPTNGVKSAGDIFRVVTEKRDTTNTN